MLLRSTYGLAAALVLVGSALAAPQLDHETGIDRFAMPPTGPPAGVQLPLDLVALGEDPAELHQFGTAMEVVGNYLFIGTPGDGNGRVDVLYRAPYGYVFVQRLFMPGSIAGQDAQFGRSLAADGGVLVVGTVSGDHAGRAVVFRRWVNGLYYYERVIAPSTGSVPFSAFGERLAVLEGELIAASAKGELAVHVFEADAAGLFPGTSTRVLNPVNTGTTPNLSWMSGFGSAVGVHRASTGEVSLLVGMQDACFYQHTQEQAPDEVTQDPTGATAARTGGVAVLRRSGSSWVLDQRLVPEWSKIKDFGFEIDVDGPHVAVGAIYSRLFSNQLDAGSASVYRREAGDFQLVKTASPVLPVQNGWFGYALELRDGHLFVGQPHLWGGPQGLVEVFRITTDDLVRVELLWAPDGNPAANPGSLGDCFGREIVCNDYGEVLVAAPFSAPNAGTPPQYGGGALYLFQ